MSAGGKLIRAPSLGINDTRIAGLYNLEHTIGKGNFAVVKLARHVFTDEKVAVKVIDKTRLDPLSAAHMMQEVRCMKLVQHPNIVRLYEIIDTQTKLFLILELGDYDMYEYIMKRGFEKGGCKESEAQQHFSQIIKAIDYCHKLHVVHRDLKPENVVFFEKLGMVKLTESRHHVYSRFEDDPLKPYIGMAQTKYNQTKWSRTQEHESQERSVARKRYIKLAPQKEITLLGELNYQQASQGEHSVHHLFGERLQTSCGSLAYSAPEILLGDPYDAPAVDIWSIGVLLFMLVCGKLPFQEANESETLTRILDCRYSLPSHISPGCRHLIARMLVRDPEKRATLAEIKSSPWVAAGDRGHAEVLPLIARDQLPDSAHCTIIEQMVAGGIGTEEEIVNAIESGDYSYMTATYYLLAERVLASYRLEQASRLLAAKTGTTEQEHYDGHDSESADTSTPGALIAGGSGGGSGGAGGRSRSRSNSWRGTISTKRACTMVKEESEEELTSYLRTSSRQSSRFYAGPPAPKKPEVRLSSHQPSGANSLDNFAATPSSLSIVEDQAEEEEEQWSADSISPRRGRFWRESVLLPDAFEAPGQQLGPLTPIREYDDAASCERMRSASGTKSEAATPVNALGTFMFPHSTAPPTPATKARRYHAAFYALANTARRNSSPSVSMLAGVPGHIRSSRERVSPQAIQELLEFSRLSSNMRRAASPESRISSRSSSPSCTSHSGRTSPAVLSLASRLKASSLMPGSGGMRKLSSSPHLLGICEESEEGTAESPTQGPFRQHNTIGSDASSTHSTFSSAPLGNKISPSSRSSRSASMGLAANIRLRRSIDAGSGLSTSFDSSITPLSGSFLLKRGDVKFALDGGHQPAAATSSPSSSIPPAGGGRPQKKHAFKKHIISGATAIEPLTETSEEAAIGQGGCEVDDLDSAEHLRKVTESKTRVAPSPQS